MGLLLSMLLVSSWAAGHTTPEYSYQRLEAWLEQPGHRSLEIEDVIAQLPLSLRSNYTLMHVSQSPQVASLKRPRAILFGETADFVAAFSGHEMADHKRLEMIQYVPATRSYELRFLEKVMGRNGPARLELSKANPQDCTRCHREDPRPNWENYPNWPGAVGENDDFVFEKRHEGTVGLNKNELQELVDFANESETLPLYRQLSPLLVEYKDKNLEHYQQTTLNKIDPSQYDSMYYVRTYGNRALSRMFSRQNFERIIRKITADMGFFESAKLSMLAAFKTCSPFDRFVPKTALARGLNFSDVRSEMELTMSGSDYYRVDDLAWASRLRTVFEAHGKTIDDFSMSFSKLGYRFTSPNNNTQIELLSELLRISPDLGQHYTCDEVANAL